MSSNVDSLQQSSESNWRFWAQAGLAVLGLLVSFYLTWIKVSGGSAYCAGVGDCETVQSSVYSEMFGLPIALFGAGFYAIVLILTMVRRRVTQQQAEYALLGQLMLVVAGTLYSGYLTYLELYVLQAICPYCVVSALIVTLLLVLSVYDLIQDEATL